MSEAYHCVVL